MRTLFYKSFLAFPALLVFVFGSSLLPGQPDSSSKSAFEKGQTIYMNRVDPLQSKPLPMAKKIMMLEKGTRVQVTNTRGSWLKISHKKKNGWVRKTAVTTSKPKNSSTSSTKKKQEEFIRNFENYKKEHDIKISRQASAPETTAGTKGLNPQNEENYEKVEGDFKQLKTMESISRWISDEENKTRRKQFAKDGNLVWQKEEKE